jgi:hypothetical protein
VLAIEETLPILRTTPDRIEAATAGATAEQLQARPAANEWSANEVLAHLRSCADCWGDCIERMIAEDHPTLRAVNPRSYIKRTDYRELDFGRSLKAYAKQRAGLLTVLEPLTPAQWERGATITGAGKELERTVHVYAQWMARHERPHVKQIAKTIEAVRGLQR